MIEDKILDLKIIFGSLSHTLSRLKKQCQVSCVEGLCVTRGCVCPNAVDDLDEQLQEIEVNMEQIEVLHRRAQATAQIVCTQTLSAGDNLDSPDGLSFIFRFRTPCRMRTRKSQISTLSPFTNLRKSLEKKTAR